MASECMECVEGRAVALGLCSHCLAGEPVEAMVGQIARLARELEEAWELIRDLVDDEDAGLVWLGRRLVCAYCTAEGLYSVAHAADCPIIRARHAIAALRSEAQGELVKEAVALIDEAVSEIAGDCQCYEEGESNG